MKKLIFSAALFTAAFATAQNTGIGTTAPKATLEVTGNAASATVADGVMAPRISRSQLIAKTGYGAAQTGAILYVTDTSGTTNAATTDVTAAGYYYFNGTKWVQLYDSVSGKNLYTADGTIVNTTGNVRTVTLPDPVESILFTRNSTSTNTNALLVVNGAIKAKGLDYNSDSRLKTNITALSSKHWEELRPVSYHWNAEGKAQGGSDALQFGFIAQEVEKVYPNLVSTDQNGYKSVNYVALIPILTEALKEEKLRNDAQQKEIDELKAIVKTLKK